MDGIPRTDLLSPDAKLPETADQRELWERIFDEEPYSMEELLSGNEHVSVGHSPYLAHVLEGISPGDVVLEAGCGRAQWVLYLDGIGVDVVGADVAVRSLGRTRELNKKLQLVGSDLNRLCFQDACFNRVLCWSVVDHIEAGPQRALQEIHRVLVRRGILFITVPCRNWLDRWLAPLLKTKDLIRNCGWLRKLMKKDGPGDVFFQNEFSRAQFTNMLTAAGFHVKTVLPFAREAGLARSINRIFLKGSRVFHRNKSERWDGLDRPGSMLCRMLAKISPWITPDELFVTAVKIKDP